MLLLFFFLPDTGMQSQHITLRSIPESQAEFLVEQPPVRTTADAQGQPDALIAFFVIQG